MFRRDRSDRLSFSRITVAELNRFRFLIIVSCLIYLLCLNILATNVALRSRFSNGTNKTKYTKYTMDVKREKNTNKE